MMLTGHKLMGNVRVMRGTSWNTEHLTLAGTTGNKPTCLWYARFTRNLMHNNFVCEVGNNHGGLTERSELLILNGHRFVLSLFSTRRTTFSTARRDIWLARQQMLGSACHRGIRGGVYSSWAGAGQLGVRFIGWPVLVLHVFGYASSGFASVATLLFGYVWVHGRWVGVRGNACPLEVARITLEARWSRGHGTGRTKITY